MYLAKTPCHNREFIFMEYVDEHKLLPTYICATYPCMYYYRIHCVLVDFVRRNFNNDKADLQYIFPTNTSIFEPREKT